jgi:glucose-6-phosphate isomerase
MLRFGRVFNLSRRNPHDMYGVADNVGGRFSPLGPKGIVVPLDPEKKLTSTLIQDAQSVRILGHLQCLEKRLRRQNHQ